MNAVTQKLPESMTRLLQLVLIILGPLTAFIVSNYVIYQYAQRDINAAVEHIYTEIDLVIPVKAMVIHSTLPVTSYLLTGKDAERRQFEESVGAINDGLKRLAEHMKIHEAEHLKKHDIEAELARGFAHEFEMIVPIQSSWMRVEERANRLVAMRGTAGKSVLAKEVELMNADAENTAILLNDLYRKLNHGSRKSTQDLVYRYMLLPVLVSILVTVWLLIMLLRILRSRD